ncbi:trimeric intracellular cation channel family protein [Photobacterium sp. SDRW27]|uniref:trimeric intracellular cation channel family protein n=1 Tax=Photobacterium obscurum TaxID=2829490 RepID=UPI00224365CF|nr:trimeric intracellular cation channel family protein [Photobacterium obscurum]MCW8331161.1 trimeric intracellular cation channel family protein [Photobacterium obscurum]
MFTYVLEMVCIVAFAFSGVLVESNRGKDIVSILLLGWVTALGGGTLRDIIINTEQVFWIRDPTYFWVALISACVGFFLITEIRKSKIEKMVILFDTIGVSLFSVLVTAKLYSEGYAAYVAIVMGMVTAVFGGVLRDILAHRSNMFNNTELYATPVILGSSLYIVISNLGVLDYIASIISMTFIVVVRLFVVIKKIRYPAFFILK